MYFWVSGVRIIGNYMEKEMKLDLFIILYMRIFFKMVKELSVKGENYVYNRGKFDCFF